MAKETRTDEQRRPTGPGSPNAPDVPTAKPLDPGQEEFSRPDADEFDGGRGGVTPEFPGDERPVPDGAPGTDVPAPPDDRSPAAVDDHMAGEPPDVGQQVENHDLGVERERLNAPNQGFRPGG